LSKQEPNKNQRPQEKGEMFALKRIFW
jgi:hypothetical protein